MEIQFESSAKYITGFNEGKVLIRCNSDLTDCGEDENLQSFIKRHGGMEKTIEYLKKCYQ